MRKLKPKTYLLTKAHPRRESKPSVTVLTDLTKAKSTSPQLLKKLSLSKIRENKSLLQNLTKEPKPPTLSLTQKNLSKKLKSYSSS